MNRKDTQRYMQTQVRALQDECERFKYRLSEAETRANNGCYESSRLQLELNTRMNSEEERVLQNLKTALGPKDGQINRMSEENGKLEKQISEAKQQLEETCRTTESALDHELKSVGLGHDVTTKDREAAEAMCCLQQSQARWSEMKEKIEKLEACNEEASRQVDCWKEQITEAKQVKSQWDKVIGKLEEQLNDMCQLKKKSLSLEGKVKEKERELELERNIASRCKGELEEAQESYNTAAEQLKTQENSCKFLRMQAGRQENELRSMNHKMLHLQAAGALKGASKSTRTKGRSFDDRPNC